MSTRPAQPDDHADSSTPTHVRLTLWLWSAGPLAVAFLAVLRCAECRASGPDTTALVLGVFGVLWTVGGAAAAMSLALPPDFVTPLERRGWAALDWVGASLLLVGVMGSALVPTGAIVASVPASLSWVRITTGLVLVLFSFVTPKVTPLALCAPVWGCSWLLLPPSWHLSRTTVWLLAGIAVAWAVARCVLLCRAWWRAEMSAAAAALSAVPTTREDPHE